MKKALIVVDYQKDFVDGALGFPKAAELEPVICDKIRQSLAIRRAFEEKGIQMDSDSSTNQQFPILTREQMDKLAQKYAYEIWEEYDSTHTVVRFCTSWATQDENVEQLLEDVRAL